MQLRHILASFWSELIDVKMGILILCSIADCRPAGCANMHGLQSLSILGIK